MRHQIGIFSTERQLILAADILLPLSEFSLWLLSSPVPSLFKYHVLSLFLIAIFFRVHRKIKTLIQASSAISAKNSRPFCAGHCDIKNNHPPGRITVLALSELDASLSTLYRFPLGMSDTFSYNRMVIGY
jgi:hypothetical protein